MSDCTHDCSSCGEACSSREQVNMENFRVQANEHSNIRKIIGVVSGKGGVGKSFVSSFLAVQMMRKGYKVGILDADITGPSIPAAFGLKGKLFGSEFGIMPCETKEGIQVISVNMMLENADAPVIWRGPVIAGVVKQFYTDVVWSDIDFLFVDMPPGTGDVPLTVFQSLPVDGIIVVTSPQELVSMVVGKAVNMAEQMKVPILGIVENYSYIECPDCGKKISVFGESHVDEMAKKYGIEVLEKLPLDPHIAKAVDEGLVELYESDILNATAEKLEKEFVLNEA
ncbi:MAG: Mrp/NBP35 family ATP-binding protein [Lachnospiraceae bacterium]|nr:Mrp/NBP35 family ATP-binding protein [Lachnospiraceae bacterium]